MNAIRVSAIAIAVVFLTAPVRAADETPATSKIGAERQKDAELNRQLHVLEQTLKG